MLIYIIHAIEISVADAYTNPANPLQTHMINVKDGGVSPLHRLWRDNVWELLVDKCMRLRQNIIC